MTPSMPNTLDLLERGRAEGRHPGGQLVVWRQDTCVADIAFGAERLDGSRITTKHRLLWMSAVKPFGAVALGILAERGRLGWDDRVADHLPAFASNGKAGVTVAHLLTHTGGFRVVPGLVWGTTYAEAVEKTLAVRPEPGWTLGERAGYHVASSWFVVAELVRQIDGRAYDVFVREEVFGPLRMPDCSIGLDENPSHCPDRPGPATPRAVTYDTSKCPPVEDFAHATPGPDAYRPGGSGWGPTNQLVRLYRMLLGGGELDGTRLITPRTVQVLTSRHRVGMYDETFRSLIDWAYGLMLHTGDGTHPYGYGPAAGEGTYGHGGHECANAFADPVHGLAVAWVLTGKPGPVAHYRRNLAIQRAIYEDLGLA